MRADFRGLFSPGAAKPWARTFPEPREFELLRFNSCRALVFSSYLQRRCQTIKSFNQFALA